MPSGSPTRHTRWGDDSNAVAYLQRQGYVLNRNWLWEPPPRIKSWSDVAVLEEDAVIYLIEEWDYGGVLISEPVHAN